jgi:uncharacterized protein involved in exopolysaccharide biosynthesis
MNLKHSVLLICSVCLLGIGAIAGSRLVRDEVPTVGFGAKSETSASQSTVAALTHQIAQLHVDESLQSTMFVENAPQLVQLRVQRSSLENRLAQLSPDRYRSLIITATASAIESKIATLEVSYAQNRLRFIDTHPSLQLQKNQLETLRQRSIALGETDRKTTS